MIPESGDAGHWLFVLFSVIMGVAILLTLTRLLRGPSLADRVVALDLLGIISVGVLVAYTIVTQRESLLGVALVAAIILFLGTAGFSIYLQRKGSE